MICQVLSIWTWHINPEPTRTAFLPGPKEPGFHAEDRIKSDGTFGFNRLLEVPDSSLGGYQEAYFADVFGSDEVFEQYQKVTEELEAAGYRRKFIEAQCIILRH